MKHQLLILSLPGIFLLQNAQAQTAQLSAADILHSNHTAVHAIHPHNAAKTTNAGFSRVIAEAQYNNNGATFVPADSVFITYSGNRGGDIEHPPIKYDAGYEYSYNTTTNSYVNADYLTQTFDANNNILTNITQSWDAGTNAYVNSDQSLFTYDGNNNNTIDISQSWNTTTNVWDNSYKYVYTYDGNHNILTETDQIWDATNNVWANNYKYMYTYTAANKVSNEVTQSWDATNNVWVNQDQYLSTYDGSNNLLTSIAQTWDGTSTWINNYQDVYTYDGMNDQLTDLGQAWNGTSWVNNSLATNSSFVSQMPQVEIYQTWDATNSVWVNTRKDLYTYNSYNQPTSLTSQTWNVGGFWQSTTSDQLVNVYYETYDLAVSSVTNTGGSANIYPVPAQNVLHIDLTWDAPQASSIAIYDMQGRILKQWQVPATTEYHNAIAVNDLAEGNYFINITGAKGQIVQKLVVAGK